MHSTQPYRRILPRAVILLACVGLAAAATCASRLWSLQSSWRRGVEVPGACAASTASVPQLGTNVQLEQYASDDSLDKALSTVREAGLVWVRQHFPWSEIEPEPGVYEWSEWDQIVAAVGRHGLRLIATLDTSPSWARRPQDMANKWSPPQYVTTYALFVRAFVQRYGSVVECYEVWDQPNLYPCWGESPIDPTAYVRLLQAAASEIRRLDPDGRVLTAGLAPTTETGGRNMSEVLFLQHMYDAGARGLFDIVAAKPYGFWSGPEDRRVDGTVLNFSRLILLREELRRRNDTGVPIWAVEFGWNALPDGWVGGSSPWGTDSTLVQTTRLREAVVRVSSEWPWLETMVWAEMQPAVPEDNPRWGFALLDHSRHLTSFYTTLQQLTQGLPSEAAAHAPSFGWQWTVLAVGSLGLLMALSWAQSRVPWRCCILRTLRLLRAQPEPVQWLLLGGCLVAYYVVPWTAPGLVLLACVVLLVTLWPHIGLTLLLVSIPFFTRPKMILGKAFSLVEVLTLLCLISWVFARAKGWLRTPLCSKGGPCLRSVASDLSLLDWAVLLFVLLATASLLVSSNRGVSIREWRVVVVEPAMLYLLLSRGKWSDRDIRLFADAVVLGGVLTAGLGLYQYFISGEVIVAEGVRRVHALYGSPNNLSLFLGRIIPLAVSVAWLGEGVRRPLHLLALVPLVACLFLTYSRAGWLLAFPAGILALLAFRGRRYLRYGLLIALLIVLLLLPLAGVERISSLLDTGSGTTFRRLSLWKSAWAMIEDHPLTGVGLDNFLYRYPEYMLPEAWEEPGLSHPHNLILDFWTRLGVLGVGALLLLEVAFFVEACHAYRVLPDGSLRAIILGLAAGMVATIAHGLVDNSYFLVDLAFVFMFGLGVVGALAKRRQEGCAPRDQQLMAGWGK